MPEHLITDLASLEALFGDVAPPSIAKEADSLRKLIADPRVGLLFLIPGVGEALRVRGRGYSLQLNTALPSTRG